MKMSDHAGGGGVSRPAVIMLPAEGVYWAGARGGGDLRGRCELWFK